MYFADHFASLRNRTFKYRLYISDINFHLGSLNFKIFLRLRFVSNSSPIPCVAVKVTILCPTI